MLQHLKTLKYQRAILIGLAVVNTVLVWSAPVPPAQLTHLVTIFFLALLYAANERLHTLDKTGAKRTRAADHQTNFGNLPA